MTKELVVIERLNPAVIFTEVEAIDAVLKGIEEQVMAHVPVLETAAGRKDIASIAYKVAQSKTLLDDLGKNLVADWKSKAKKVDEVRKHTRDFLDDLKVRVRQPLTEWEEAEAAREAAEKQAKEYEEAWDAAIVENDLIDRQRAIEAKEEEMRKAEEARLAKEQAEREAKEAEALRVKEEQDRKEREARIAKEAAEKAQAESERKIKEAHEAAEKAERDRIAAEERAKVEQEMAVKAAEARAKAEAERVERERLEKEAAEKAKAEKIAANKRHRAKVEKEALDSLVEIGFDNIDASRLVVVIREGKIKNVTINY